MLGVFTTRRAANRCAQEHWIDIGGEDEEEDDEDDEEDEDSDDEVDFVGEGKFIDGMESSDVNTFSQRVFVEKKKLQR